MLQRYEAQADEDDDAAVVRRGHALGITAVLQPSGGNDEDDQREDQPALAEQERSERDATEDDVGHHGQHGMAHELRVGIVSGPLDSLGELALRIHHQVLDVVVHAAHAVLSGARAPDETVQ